MEKGINDIADLLCNNTNLTSEEIKITHNKSLISICGKFRNVINLDPNVNDISISTMDDEGLEGKPLIHFSDYDDRSLGELVRLFRYNPLVLKTIEALCANIFYEYDFIDCDYDVIFDYNIDRGIYVNDVDISVRVIREGFELWSTLHTELSPNYGLLVGPTVYQYVKNTVIHCDSLNVYEDISIDYIKPTGQFYMSEEYVMRKIDEYYNKIKNENSSV